MWLLAKLAGIDGLPTACSASLWLFEESTGKVHLACVFLRRSWLQNCGTLTGENRTRVRHSALFYPVAVTAKGHLTNIADSPCCPSFEDTIQQHKICANLMVDCPLSCQAEALLLFLNLKTC